MNIEGFWARVDRADAGDCWEWVGSRTSAGYGNLRFEGGWDYAHRVSYRLARGEIPSGLVIDHLCRNRACVNPNHLEPVDRGENNRRGLVSYSIRGECKHGHDITNPVNVYVRRNGHRQCRVCDRIREQKRAARRSAVA